MGLGELDGIWTSREATGMKAIPRRLLVLGAAFPRCARQGASALLSTVAGVELMRDPAKRLRYAAGEQIGVRVIQAARRRGVVIRPLGDVVIFMPPLSIGEDELELLLEVTRTAIEEATGA